MYLFEFYKQKKTMKNKLLNIEKIALMLFNDVDYDIFINYVSNSKINSARFFLEEKLNYLDIQDNSNLYNRLEDMLLDLIIEGNVNEQSENFIKNTG